MSAKKSGGTVPAPYKQEGCTKYFIRLHTPRPDSLNFSSLWKMLNDIHKPDSLASKGCEVVLLGENRKADFIEYAFNMDDARKTEDAVSLEIYLPHSCDPYSEDVKKVFKFIQEQVYTCLNPNPAPPVITTVQQLVHLVTPSTPDPFLNPSAE